MDITTSLQDAVEDRIGQVGIMENLAPSGKGLDGGQDHRTHLDYGPEILYRTPHRVLGTTYHRNSEGILAGFAILGGTDLAQVRGLIQTRGVDLILVCPLQSWIYGAESAGDEVRPSLHDLLLEGNEPDGLERVPVPAPLDSATGAPLRSVLSSQSGAGHYPCATRT